jgi:hydroxymethylglutaryl-CoA reductase
MVAEGAEIDSEILSTLNPENGLDLQLADHMVENVIGMFGLPLGVATNFVVNGVEVLIPIATEEASVVAAAATLRRSRDTMAEAVAGKRTTRSGCSQSCVRAPDWH